MDYTETSRLVSGKDRVPIRRALALVQQGDEVRLMLHDSTLIEWRKDGSIQLDAQGLRTRTRRELIAQYLPYGYKMAGKDKEWLVQLPDGKLVAFEDKMVLGKGESGNGNGNGYKPPVREVVELARVENLIWAALELLERVRTGIGGATQS